MPAFCKWNFHPMLHIGKIKKWKKFILVSFWKLIAKIIHLYQCTLVNTNHWKPNVNNYLRHWIILSMLDTNHQLRLSRKHFKYKGTFISPPVNIKLQFCTFSSDQCVIIIKATLHISFIIEKILAVLCVCNYIT